MLTSRNTDGCREWRTSLLVRSGIGEVLEALEAQRELLHNFQRIAAIKPIYGDSDSEHPFDEYHTCSASGNSIVDEEETWENECLLSDRSVTDGSLLSFIDMVKLRLEASEEAITRIGNTLTLYRSQLFRSEKETEKLKIQFSSAQDVNDDQLAEIDRLQALSVALQSKWARKESLTRNSLEYASREACTMAEAQVCSPVEDWHHETTNYCCSYSEGSQVSRFLEEPQSDSVEELIRSPRGYVSHCLCQLESNEDHIASRPSLIIQSFSLNISNPARSAKTRSVCKGVVDITICPGALVGVLSEEEGTFPTEVSHHESCRVKDLEHSIVWEIWEDAKKEARRELMEGSTLPRKPTEYDDAHANHELAATTGFLLPAAALMENTAGLICAHFSRIGSLLSDRFGELFRWRIDRGLVDFVFHIIWFIVASISPSNETRGLAALLIWYKVAFSSSDDLRLRLEAHTQNSVFLQHTVLRESGSEGYDSPGFYQRNQKKLQEMRRFGRIMSNFLFHLDWRPLIVTAACVVGSRWLNDCRWTFS